MKTHLNHMQINVTDAKKSLPFYKDFFGFLDYSIIDENDGYIGVSNGTVDFWIIQTEEKYKKNGFHRKNTGLNHVAFGVSDRRAVDDFYESFLKQKNIPTLYGTPKLFPEYHEGYYAVFFEGPDRIKIEIAYIPK